MKNALVWIFIVTLAIAVSGCSMTGNTVSSNENKTIKIALMVPLTGDMSNLGQSTKNAVQLAAEEINNAGGINGAKLELIYEDSRCNGKDATNAATKLIDIDKVHYIIGGVCSSETLAAAPLAEKAKTVYISPCASNPDITNAGDFIFRDYPSDLMQGKYAAEFTFNDLKARKVALLTCLSDWCAGLHDVFKERFQELGGKIVESQTFERVSFDFRTQFTKIKESNPDLIFFVAYTESAINGLKQAKEMGINATILGADAWADTTIWKQTKGFADGVMFVSVKSDPPEDFKQKYIQRFGNESYITVCAVQGYDAMKILGNVMEKTGDDSVAVKNELYNVKDYPGVSGDITFDKNGDLLDANYVVMVVKDGVPVTRGEAK